MKKENPAISGKEKRLELRSLLSSSGISKITVTILVVVVAVAVTGISYVATHPPSPRASPSPTAFPLPTGTLAPSSSLAATPTTTPSPITTKTPTPTPPATPTPTSSVSPAPTLTPGPTELTIREKVRDSAMYYLKNSHPETAQFIKDLVWTGGRVTTPIVVGAETYMYYSLGWNVTINYPVVPDPIYNIVADYSAIGTSIPYRIIWKGTWHNEVINETSYVFAQ